MAEAYVSQSKSLKHMPQHMPQHISKESLKHVSKQTPNSPVLLDMCIEAFIQAHIIRECCFACRRVDVKKAWAVHLAEQQQKQQEGSDAEEEQKADEAVDPAEVQPSQSINQSNAVHCLGVS